MRRHRGPDPRADRPRPLHRQPLEREDGRRGRGGGGRPGRGRAPGPRPGTVAPPAGVAVVRVETAEEMHAAVVDRFAEADVVVMAAAVADFRPKAADEGKLKKEAGVPDLDLEPTPDILARAR